MLSLAKLAEVLEFVRLVPDAFPAREGRELFLASDLGAYDDGNLIVCVETPTAFVQVGTIAIETGEISATTEDPLRWPK